MESRYENRVEAGRTLIPLLGKYRGTRDTLVVSIPRGGVQIGGFVARQLGLPLEVALVKKLSAPDSHELALGAVTLDGGLLVDEKTATEFGATKEYLGAQQKLLSLQLADRNRTYHAGVPEHSVQGKTVLLVDDGMATGYTVRAAAEMLRRQGARKIIAAVPISSESAKKLVEPVVDQLVVTKVDPLLYAVGSHYKDFAQVSDSEVVETLLESRRGTL